MSTSVDTIQSRIASRVDLDQNTSNTSSDDYALRLVYINERERMWAEIAKWDVLYKEYNTLTSTASGNTSISLPTDFRELASFPHIATTGTANDSFVEITPQNQDQYNPESDQFVKILGNSNTGYVMKVNPGTSTRLITSGASIMVPYFSVPTSLASPADVITCPNPEYLVEGVIADIWESREDGRFQRARGRADRILQNMLEFEFTPSQASENREVKTIEKTRFAFRWGK